ncbi:hypothetical protein EDEG_00037 [Edhazardia aedis USNM 41457]|uniref:U3 small nucleolar RNA-associated protein 6 N-terminal domain-containing protein n=1 Tax=Edhazardia aedis (strain USNM 41457) TaxID=1003232 RepID=J8ZP15_EDHAE|nr:hypothetical protein EDEG_00037 [Edhazardia aedis USNM 41457]|eukprot:EJW01443.1 hypothetical protein EDEG_00037 [Edhazardia aedis USNM 41457]
MFNNLEARLETIEKEIKTYEDLQIFTNDELNTISKKLNGFEHKISISTEDNFLYILKYIQYLQILQKLIKKRLSNSEISNNRNSEKNSNCDNNITVYKHRGRTRINRENTRTINQLTQKIHRLYKKALKTTPNFIKTFKSYIQYCIKIKDYVGAKKAMTNECLLHLNDTDLFVYCAFICADFLDFQTARIFLLKALRLVLCSESKLKVLFALFNVEVMWLGNLYKVYGEGNLKEGEDIFGEEDVRGAVQVFKEIVNEYGSKEISFLYEIACGFPFLLSEMDKYLQSKGIYL